MRRLTIFIMAGIMANLQILVDFWMNSIRKIRICRLRFQNAALIRSAANIKNRNLKGLVTFDRKTRKGSFYDCKAMWSDAPFVSIASKRYVNRTAETVTVKVYSNQPEITIEVGKKEYKSAVFNGSAVFRNIPLEMGENKITARAGTAADETVFIRQETADEFYVYVDQNPGL